eukprot:jgi/Chlat1/2128/Chrsp17S00186
MSHRRPPRQPIREVTLEREAAVGADVLLQKARELRGFLHRQKRGASQASDRQAWLLASHRLHDEQVAAERELADALAAAAEHVGEEELADCEAGLEDERERDLIQVLNWVLGSNNNKANVEFDRAAHADQLRKLEQEAAALEAELRANRPSALSNNNTNSFLNTTTDPNNDTHTNNDSSDPITTRTHHLLTSLLTCFPSDPSILSELHSAFTSFASSHATRLASFPPVPACPSGWGPGDQARFVAVRRGVMRECIGVGNVNWRERVVESVGKGMEGKGREEILAFEDWYVRRRSALDRRKAALHAFERGLHDLHDRSRLLLIRAREVAQTGMEKAVELVRAEAAAARAAAARRKGREAREGEREKEREREREGERRERERERREKESREEEQRQRKLLIAAYRDDLAAAEAASAAQVAAEEAEHAHQAALEAARNAERVEYRREEERARAQARAAKAEADTEAEALRERRLDSLRAQVAPVVSADPERVLQPTAAVAAERMQLPGKAFNPVNGYTTHELMRDQRFKIAVALRDAGLHQTEAGRAAVASAAARAQPRRDQLTTDALARLRTRD